MSRSIYFVRECPTCGRQLHIHVEHMGREVVCQHCSGRFVAIDPAIGRSPPVEKVDALLRRADELLDSAGRKLDESRSLHPR